MCLQVNDEVVPGDGSENGPSFMHADELGEADRSVEYS